MTNNINSKCSRKIRKSKSSRRIHKSKHIRRIRKSKRSRRIRKSKSSRKIRKSSRKIRKSKRKDGYRSGIYILNDDLHIGKRYYIIDRNTNDIIAHGIYIGNFPSRRLFPLARFNELIFYINGEETQPDHRFNNVEHEDFDHMYIFEEYGL